MAFFKEILTHSGIGIPVQETQRTSSYPITSYVALAAFEIELLEFHFNSVVHIMFAELTGDSNGILDGVGIGSPVTHNGDSLDASRGAPPYSE